MAFNLVDGEYVEVAKVRPLFGAGVNADAEANSNETATAALTAIEVIIFETPAHGGVLTVVRAASWDLLRLRLCGIAAARPGDYFFIALF